MIFTEKNNEMAFIYSTLKLSLQKPSHRLLYTNKSTPVHYFVSGFNRVSQPLYDSGVHWTTCIFTFSFSTTLRNKEWGSTVSRSYIRENLSLWLHMIFFYFSVMPRRDFFFLKGGCVNMCLTYLIRFYNFSDFHPAILQFRRSSNATQCCSKCYQI